eukprot:6263037-Amphidinium_carterae.1
MIAVLATYLDDEDLICAIESNRWQRSFAYHCTFKLALFRCQWKLDNLIQASNIVTTPCLANLRQAAHPAAI